MFATGGFLATVPEAGHICLLEYIKIIFSGISII